jgi:hypothetical protein
MNLLARVAVTASVASIVALALPLAPTATVFDRPGGVFLGTTPDICTTISGDETAGQTSCSGTFNLDGGQIMVQGLADNAALFGRGETNPLAIIGGTGIYRNARGDGTIQVPPDVPDQTDGNFVLNVRTG